MMYRFLLVLAIINAIVLTTVVLLQSGKGGGLASLGGGSTSESFFGGRQAVTILTKLSWWCGGIFLGLALMLAGLSSRSAAPTSVLEGGIAPPAVAPLPLDMTQPTTGGADAGAGAETPSGDQ